MVSLGGTFSEPLEREVAEEEVLFSRDWSWIIHSGFWYETIARRTRIRTIKTPSTSGNLFKRWISLSNREVGFEPDALCTASLC